MTLTTEEVSKLERRVAEDPVHETVQTILALRAEVERLRYLIKDVANAPPEQVAPLVAKRCLAALGEGGE